MVQGIIIQLKPEATAEDFEKYKDHAEDLCQEYKCSVQLFWDGSGDAYVVDPPSAEAVPQEPATA